jgi:hypothetical protein
MSSHVTSYNVSGLLFSFLVRHVTCFLTRTLQNMWTRVDLQLLFCTVLPASPPSSIPLLSSPLLRRNSVLDVRPYCALPRCNYVLTPSSILHGLPSTLLPHPSTILPPPSFLFHPPANLLPNPKPNPNPNPNPSTLHHPSSLLPPPSSLPIPSSLLPPPSSRKPPT